MTDTLRVSLLVLLALAAGCGPGLHDGAEPGNESESDLEAASSEIIGGSTESGYPGVAMLYHDYGYLCSGTMIDERVYLTAGHCIETLSASHYGIYGGTNLNTNEPDWSRSVASVHRHPQLVLSNSNIDHDVGIVVLAEDAPVKPYRWLAEDEDGVYTEGTLFDAVGYGVTANGSGDGIKRSVQLSIEQVYSNIFEYGGSNYNTCSGDSGGPAIAEVDGYLTVIGVVSYGDQNCDIYGADMRTDDNRAFIEGFASPKAGRVRAPGFESEGGSDNPLACSVASVESRSPLAAALLALVAFAGVITRRRL